LPTRKTLDQDLREDVLVSLQRFATRYGHTQDPYLVRLSDALETGGDIQTISILDPASYLPTRSRIQTGKRLRLSRLIAGIRNVLIFVPVALTWAAVGEATIAFNEFVQRNSGTPANFLQFWQDGYGVLDPFWAIGNIATIDFYLVTAIILMTGTVALMQASGQREKDRQFAEFEVDRRELALQIEILRYSRRPARTSEIPADLSSALRELRITLAKAQSGKEMLAASKQLERQTQIASAAISKIQSFATSLERNTRAISKALNDITKSTERAAKQASSKAAEIEKRAQELELETKRVSRTPR
jgi:hypothetical protein